MGHIITALQPHATTPQIDADHRPTLIDGPQRWLRTNITALPFAPHALLPSRPYTANPCRTHLASALSLLPLVGEVGAHDCVDAWTRYAVLFQGQIGSVWLLVVIVRHRGKKNKNKKKKTRKEKPKNCSWIQIFSSLCFNLSAFQNSRSSFLQL